MAARFRAVELPYSPSPPSPTSRRRRHPGNIATLHRQQNPHPLHVASARKPWQIEEKDKPKTICRASEIQCSEQPWRREPLRRGTVSPRLPVPGHIPLPPYAGTDRLPDVSPDRQLHVSESISRMRAACELAARVLEHAGTLVKPSVTTDEIDRAVHQMIIDAGAYPSPLGYGGFPKSVCTSVNECICHGIPDSRPLQNGDIINIDVTVYLNGYHGDTSRTYLCGQVDESAMQLVKVTEECMLRGISACKHGASFSTIGQKISELVDEYGYGIDPFVGHGVGKIFHSEPIIWHTYDYEPGYMVAGQTFTVGTAYTVHGGTECTLWDDGWTAVTVDGSLNAQFEHTILVTGDGAEILTARR
ncbi:hypothetical protein GUJ93_ZPchr0034g18712 [Zizania palustris]|uniref:Peptidase M24 domain-containing protein n=1 Tax=Zizania palustris TaxID=103762 RepID=A0A8J5QQI7_ZIZPA|nr:hypothetical protein GUJ93_ZPchr0034g18712 [Zizania palustris]